MAGRGPLPGANTRRRNVRITRRGLPASGRSGDPPPFPIGKPTKAVADLWADLWASPQAVAWEDFGWTRVVARYARLVVAAEKPKAPAALLNEVRQLEDRLGLSPVAMVRLQWEIVDDQPFADDDHEQMSITNIDEYRRRLEGTTA